MTTVLHPTPRSRTAEWWQPVWDIFRPELLPLFRALSEIALLTPLAMRFMPWARLWPPAGLGLWLLTLMLVPYYVDRVLALAGVRPGRRRVYLLLGALLAVVLNVRLLIYDPPQPWSLAWLGELFFRLTEPNSPAIQQDVSVIVFTALAWWRGMALAGRGVDNAGTGRFLRLSLILFLPAIILISGNPLRQIITPYILLFFAGILMTIALTRAQQVEFGESGAAFPVTPGWLARVLIPSVGLAFVTGIFTALLSGQPLAGVLGWLSPLWLAVSATTNTVLALLFRVANPLFNFIDWLFAAFRRLFTRLPQATATPAPTPDNGTPAPTPSPESVYMPIFDQQTVETFLQIAGILFVVATLALVLYLSFRSRRQLDTGREVFTSDRTPTPGAGGLPRPGAGFLDNIRQWRRLRMAASIRRIYENTLVLAAQNGFPRPATATPHEYIATLNRVWPEQPGEIDLITQAYVRVRYGEVPESKAEFEAIRHAWDTLRRTPPALREEEAPTDENA